MTQLPLVCISAVSACTEERGDGSLPRGPTTDRATWTHNHLGLDCSLHGAPWNGDARNLEIDPVPIDQRKAIKFV
jgi:hypothetical protein